MTCDPRTIEVIKKGIEYGELSDGKFDITIGQVTDLWDFHAEEPELPSASKIKAALAAVDYHQDVYKRQEQRPSVRQSWKVDLADSHFAAADQPAVYDSLIIDCRERNSICTKECSISKMNRP